MEKLGCVKEGRVDPWPAVKVIAEYNPSPVEIEIRNRIRLSVASYAYEYKDDSIMSDAEFDALSYKIDVSVSTKNRKLDNFFKKHFEPCTGMWIRRHPEKNKLEWLYQKYYKNNAS